MTDSRRAFLKLFGAGVTAAAWPLGPGASAAGASAGAGIAAGPRTVPFGLGFTPVRPGSEDALRLPTGFTYDVIAAWGEALPGTTQRFGFNADYTAFLPIGDSGDEGVLWVNHEYVRDPKQAFSAYDQAAPGVLGHEATIDDELTDIGASVLHLRKRAGRWGVVASPLTRRYDVRSRLTPTGPALRGVADVGGTLANCSGCHTPWHTVLSCEENYQDFVPDVVDTTGHGTVGGRVNRNGAHFGWVCEFDPLDPSFTPVKHTALGRFRHENVALRVTPGRPAVAYMGDDRIDGHVYRFVSTQSYHPDSARNRGSLLASGRLYAAVFRPDGTGTWRELAEGTPLAPNADSPHPPVPAGALLLGDIYRDLGAIVTDAFHASNLIGATECGRPEDVEVRAADGAVYIAFTAAAERGARLFSNPYGEIWRIQEDGDGTGLTFTWTRWLAGGPNDEARAGSIFAAPDNLSFDTAGHIWVVTDMSSKALAGGDPAYSAFGNNGVFVISLDGDDAGMPRQFASAPSEAELTGPSWTPAGDTLFLSVQHPGEVHGMRLDRGVPRGSNWPSGVAGRHPTPGVVAIRRR